MSSIVVNGISKRFRIPHHKKTTLFQNMIGLVKRQMTYEELWALNNVSFKVQRGETVGIIGRNGSGKSTLLKLLAKVLYPDSGAIEMTGKVASFLELGAGFQPELTARENVYIYSSIMGMNRRDTSKIYDDIFEFAELKRFEDMKLKNYSSGMYLRLAFATAIQTDPDIMLIDEVLAVGDEAFQKKCLLKIDEFKARGKTIVFVSHSLESVQSICTSAILLHNGSVVARGAAEPVIKKYMELLN